MDTLKPHWPSLILDTDCANKFEAKNSRLQFLSLFIFIEPQNILFFKISSDVISGLRVFIPIKVVFTYNIIQP